MYEIRRYLSKRDGKEFVGIMHAGGEVVVLETNGVLGPWYYTSEVEPVHDPSPAFDDARKTLGKLQRLLLEWKIPCMLVDGVITGWQCKVVDEIQCWVPPPPSPLRAAIEWTEPLAERNVPFVCVTPARLKLLVDAAKKQLAAEKGKRDA